MDLTLNASERAFRDEVATWLAENAPRERRPPAGPAMVEFDVAWQRRQFDAGWAGISWPAEYGGRGLSLVQQVIWYSEYARAGAPTETGVCFVGNAHAGPTLIACADEELKQRHLPRILSGEEIWCQGFSEPGAGSDLAGLSTRAVIDGDHLVVNGQKIWTSYAHHAQQQELLVRTSTGARRQDGITWVVCPMDTPGIEVRPIRTITGHDDFCEVFYDDVRIPLTNVVGAVDDGWRVAMSTLSFERGTGFLPEQVELVARVDELVDLARTRTDRAGRALIEDSGLAERLATARAEAHAVLAMTLAVISRNARSSQPGPEASMVRLLFSQLQQRVAALAVDLRGLEGLAEGSPWVHDYLYLFATTIAAGTKDVQRGIVAERVLGLPRGR
ncbi:acyl-CoA dehydrogenase family protein [Sporichthya polymorpha]|uniref:acyl-CoA dehydrogenase family protein n=1 Tax=Sporichthya polymorpha TaxID=35751 RepID=UPI00036EE792|nr:acyl-CoA dehydrogenase family protein [Sporichthya polymorpha]